MASSLRICVAVAAIATALTSVSCDRRGADRKPTYPLTGQVYVDGKPAAGVSVFCRDARGMDAERPTLSSTISDEDGLFRLSTYETADGVPNGEYFLTFEWRDYSAFTGAYEGADKLRGRYASRSNSPLGSVLVDGTGQDLGHIGLSTE